MFAVERASWRFCVWRTALARSPHNRSPDKALHDAPTNPPHCHRLGATLIYVDVTRDEEAGVYVATSPDVRGLVAEAPTFDELFQEVEAGVDELTPC